MITAPTTALAIAEALAQNWKEAIRINLSLLTIDSKNIDALNRLGYAYIQTGQTNLAKQCFKKVLALDQYNTIASRNLNKLLTGKQRQTISQSALRASPLTFLEEPGKTKIAVCVKLAPAKTLLTLSSGQEVQLKPKRHSVEIRNGEMYLGVLPDDLSFKLIKFISGGNRYQVVVQSIGVNTLVVFLRELSRGKRFAKQPSFSPSMRISTLSRLDMHSYTEKPDVSPTGEEESDNETDKEDDDAAA